MSLTSLWISAKEQLLGKQVHQVIGFAGDGRLRDAGVASKEFREFLANIPSDLLDLYAKQCLGDEKFPESGCALQDIINEVGRRVGFTIESGLYRGKPNEVGFDGLWKSADEWKIVVEVKTTDAYSIDLETLADYRKKLIAAGRLQEESSSILIVVGRADTGSWEAQVRGSRHAWDIRLIGVEALLKLMKIKEQLDHPDTIRKIRAVLTPKEFTKLDDIIDLVFTTAKEVQLDSEEEEADEGERSNSTQPKIPVDFRDACASRLQDHLKTSLVKRSRAFYTSADEFTGVCCLNSRSYNGGFWFTFHPHQNEQLTNYKRAFLALGCGSDRKLLLLPHEKVKSLLGSLNRTSQEKRGSYWHMHVRTKNDEGSFILKGTGGRDIEDLTPFLLT